MQPEPTAPVAESAPLPPVLPRTVYMALQRSPHRHLPGLLFYEAWKQVGPIFRIPRRDGSTDMVLAGAEANHFFQTEGGQSYTYAEEIRRKQNEVLGIRHALVSLHGEPHYQMRKLHKPGYSRHVIHESYPLIVETVREWSARWQPGEIIDVEAVLPRIVAEVLCRAIHHHPTVQPYFDDLIYYIRTLTLATVAGLLPAEELETERFKEAGRRVMQHADEILAAHRASREGRSLDVLDDVLDATAAEPGLFTEQELRYTALGAYIGGLDSVANTCAFMVYSLLANPDFLTRVQSELDAGWQGDTPTPEALRDMLDLRHAAYETLRLYPVSFAVKSTVHTPFEFAGYRVEAGTELISASTVSHFDERYFPDPFTFNPDRFAPPRQEHRQAGAFAPYGVGAHLCLGAGLADVLIVLIVATLLRETEFAIHPADYQLTVEMKPTALPKHLGLRVVRPRR